MGSKYKYQKSNMPPLYVIVKDKEGIINRTREQTMTNTFQNRFLHTVGMTQGVVRIKSRRASGSGKREGGKATLKRLHRVASGRPAFL